MAKRDLAYAASHFDGPAGKRRLIEAVKSQTLVAHDERLAKNIVKVAQLEHHESKTELMSQGALDNDLLLIVSGTVSIRVNGREIATRQGGTHVGEMALVDALAKRSATVVTSEATITLRLTEHSFSKLAVATPELWRRVAVEVANRLRERNKFIREPNNQPLLFIGSSSEGLKIAEELSRYFAKRPVVSKLWTDGVFRVSRTPIESLVAIAANADFAILVLTPDDLTVSRKKKLPSPRDNVIFELGLFIGALGRDRVVILKPKKFDTKIPSDLLGIAWLEYAAGGAKTLKDRLRNANVELWKLIKTHGSR